MEDRVRALETELSTLKTTLNTSTWWLGILGAFLIGGLGVTNYFTIPSAINSAFIEKGGQGLILPPVKFLTARDHAHSIPPTDAGLAVSKQYIAGSGAIRP
jgi:hypothetical protein